MPRPREAHVRSRVALLAASTIAGLAVVALGCVPDAPTEPRATVLADGVQSSRDIASGRAIYSASCAKCHQLYAPGSYTPDQWRAILPRMARKARLSDGDTQKVLSYLLSAAR